MESNGTPDFTNRLGQFTLEGHTFRRKKVDARTWAETLERVRQAEEKQTEEKPGLLFAVSAEGMNELIRIALNDDDVAAWDTLWDGHQIEFGELMDISTWLREQMMERPFSSETDSSGGPGSSGASSKGGSSSPVEAPTG